MPNMLEAMKLAREAVELLRELVCELPRLRGLLEELRERDRSLL